MRNVLRSAIVTTGAVILTACQSGTASAPSPFAGGALPDTYVCRSIDVTDASDTFVAYLIGAGWWGAPDDGAEVLYPPTC